MKLTFILPAIGKKKNIKYIGTWKMEPLTIAVLKALTPNDIETDFFDDRIELIDYDIPTDIVAITTETYTAKRAYQIAEKFREKGKKIIMGGYHATLCPDEAAKHCDTVITGNAENVWAQVLSDFYSGSEQKFYHGEPVFSRAAPDKSIFEKKKYLPVSLVEIGRGCNLKCEFCSISGYYCSKYYARNHDEIVEDIKKSRHKYFFLVDDNLLADKKNALALFEKIKPLNIKWAGQGTLSVADDKEFLAKMKESGCELILIGFESLEAKTLKQMNKSVNLKKKDLDILVENVHNAGIGIYATFVFGYGDTKESFRKTLEFCTKHKMYTVAFNHLLPFPGTLLYERLKEEERLIYNEWWLEDGYHYGELALNPDGELSAEEISKLCRDTRKEYSSFVNVLKRGFAAMRRSNFKIWFLFWVMNLQIGREIDEKMNIPIGENLDELPK